MSRRAVLIAASLTLIVGGISVLFYYYARDKFAEWLSTLSATFIGALLAAAVGVALFNYQVKRNEEGRRKQLDAAFAGELQATLDVLESSPNVKVLPPQGTGELPVEVVVTHLEPVACEEIIRNALNTSRDVMALSHLARAMRSYNAQAEILVAYLGGVMASQKQSRDFQAAKVLKRAQEHVISFCTLNIEELENEGVEIPPRHYSRKMEAEPQ